MSSSGETDSGMCPWCSAPVAEAATQCSACGAAVAQRESIGNLVIPGVTNVDPGLEAYAAQPLRIPGASPSQRIAGSAAGAAVMGGPEGLIALGGLAAVAAAEFLAAGREDAKRAAELERLGQPSGAVLDMVKRLDDKFVPPTAGAQHAEGGAIDAEPPDPQESSGIY